MRRLAQPVVAALAALAAVATLSGPAAAATYDGPVEDYAPYQPQERCRDTPRPGTRQLAEWINDRFSGGPAVASIRACGSGGVSEHKDGRAIDWSMDATDDAQRSEVRRLLDKLFATDRDGKAHAKARRMGIMYVIWNDHMWASYDTFAREDYLNGACVRRSSCSPTLRHRDHVHLSLSLAGGRGDTSWYTRH